MLRKTKCAVPGGAGATQIKKETMRKQNSTIRRVCQAAGIAGAVLALTAATNADAIGFCVIPAWKVRAEEEKEIVLEVKSFQYNERLISGLIPEEAAPKLVEAAKSYTDAELEMLACVIYQEAGGDEATDETRRMVGEVVLNRVNDPRFPDTIEGVLLQKSQYGRMHWTGIIWPARASNPNEAYAVERAYRCAEAVFAQDRLLPEDVVWQAEFKQGKECVVHVDGYYFCR